MAAADQGGPDLYGLPGAGRDAARDQIAQAWRRAARAGHPDTRPADPAAPDRFRAVAGRAAPHDRLAVLAELALRLLAPGRDGPW